MKRINKFLLKELNRKKYSYHLSLISEYTHRSFDSKQIYINFGLVKKNKEKYIEKLTILKTFNYELFNEYVNNSFLIIKDLLKDNNLGEDYLRYIAYLINNKKIINKLEKNNSEKISSKLHYACLGGNMKLVKQIIEYYNNDEHQYLFAFFASCCQKNFKISKLVHKILCKKTSYGGKHFEYACNHALLNNNILAVLFCKSKGYIFHNEKTEKLWKKVDNLKLKNPKVKSINNKNIRKTIRKYIPKNPF